jgi:hypothetical protein
VTLDRAPPEDEPFERPSIGRKPTRTAADASVSFNMENLSPELERS